MSTEELLYYSLSDASVDPNTSYNKTSDVNSIQLIREVKKHRLLYDNHAEGYNNQQAKEFVWEEINEALFPDYRTLPPEVQIDISKIVRRRWQTLRSTLSRDLRYKVKDKNYQQNDSVYITEMQFLVPFIRSIYAKVAQRQNQSQEERNRINDENTMYHDIANMAMETQDELIDLTTIEEKPVTRTMTNQPLREVNTTEADSTPNYVSQEPVSTTTDQVHSSQTGYNSFSSELATPRSYNTREFGADSSDLVQTFKRIPVQSAPFPDKRRRTEDTNEEIQDKILSLVSNSLRKDPPIQRDSEDEDRMFLLSLVSDLKCISSNRKMLVKAEIATAIARGQQQTTDQ